MSKKKRSFFSIPFNFITTGVSLAYDLFVNSSSRESKEHFIRIFPTGELLSVEDLDKLKKYHQLYVPECQRSQYLKSLVKNDNVDDVEKTSIIKDSAIGYLDTLFSADKTFTTEILNEAITGCRDAVESMVDVVQDHDVSKIQELIGSLSFHDFYTYDHSINVSMYCISIFKAMVPNANKEQLITAGLGGLLHDLGKIKIPTTIINNPGKLSDEDFEEIKAHPTHGLELLMQEKECCEGLDIEAIGRTIYEHHENFNGSGYPNHKVGKDIHLLARITACADFFDAITTKRSYHEVLSVDEAVNVMAKSKGKKLDPKVFEIFLKTIKKMERQGKMNKELPDSFDPCQPHAELPLQEVAKEEKEEKDFGKIRLLDKEDKKGQTANKINKKKAS